ncbi:hypothetical protein BSL78_17866 [Apostichopus japonicus]|uniref:Uncharacterized protein n=1 Tax=Stichopus japonicus TaxID=307972 RepID=A0A2G8KBD4_STIJA|nr:hypothetical protein BSL78_17866 [Apostichopus japonicus]
MNTTDRKEDETCPPGIPEGLPKEMWIDYLLEMRKVEAQIEIEKSKQDHELNKAKVEADKEVKLQQLQTEKETAKVQANPTSVASGESVNLMKVPRLHENEDVDVYLRGFEMLAETNKWDKSQWAIFFIPNLSGKAKEAYVNLPITESQNYDTIKAAILTESRNLQSQI